MNYFEVLGMAPSLDVEDVKAAFLKSMSQYHPDKKSADITKCQEIATAWDVLQDKERLWAYYNFILNGGNHASLTDLPGTKNQAESKADLVTQDAGKVKVFIPVFIPHTDELSRLDGDIENSKLSHGLPRVNRHRLYKEKFDFEAVAKIVNGFLARFDALQVGMNEDEGNVIAGQHNWNLRGSEAYYLLEVYVSLPELNADAKSEREIWPSFLDVGSDRLLYLKINSQLMPDHIVGLTKQADYSRDRDLPKTINNKELSVTLPANFLAKEKAELVGAKERLEMLEKLESQAKAAQQKAQSGSDQTRYADTQVLLAQKRYTEALKYAEQARKKAESLRKDASSALQALEIYKNGLTKKVEEKSSPVTKVASHGSLFSGAQNKKTSKEEVGGNTLTLTR